MAVGMIDVKVVRNKQYKKWQDIYDVLFFMKVYNLVLSNKKIEEYKSMTY